MSKAPQGSKESSFWDDMSEQSLRRLVSDHIHKKKYQLKTTKSEHMSMKK